MTKENWKSVDRVSMFRASGSGCFCPRRDRRKWGDDSCFFRKLTARHNKVKREMNTSYKDVRSRKFTSPNFGSSPKGSLSLYTNQRTSMLEPGKNSKSSSSLSFSPLYVAYYMSSWFLRSSLLPQRSYKGVEILFSTAMVHNERNFLTSRRKKQ